MNAQAAISIFTFPLVVAIMFGGGILLFRYLTAWPKLAHVYGRNMPLNAISKGSYRWVPCKIGWVTITASIEIYPGGLRMKPGFPLFFVMPPVYLPWEHIAVISSKRGIFTRQTVLRIADFARVLTITGNIGLPFADTKNTGLDLRLITDQLGRVFSLVTLTCAGLIAMAGLACLAVGSYGLFAGLHGGPIVAGLLVVSGAGLIFVSYFCARNRFQSHKGR